MSTKYFARCRGECVYDWEHMPTVCGLALSLGFSKKEDLFSFKGTGLAEIEIQRALTVLESAVEEALYKKDTHQAAKMVLCCQFKNWQSKEDSSSFGKVTIVDDIGGGGL